VPLASFIATALCRVWMHWGRRPFWRSGCRLLRTLGAFGGHCSGDRVAGLRDLWTPRSSGASVFGCLGLWAPRGWFWRSRVRPWRPRPRRNAETAAERPRSASPLQPKQRWSAETTVHA